MPRSCVKEQCTAVKHTIKQLRKNPAACRLLSELYNIELVPPFMGSCAKKPLKHQEPPLMTIKQEFMTVAGTINQCRRCQATSKRTKLQCGAPAMRGKQVCRTHGGLSSGPKTVEGRNRCAAARTVYGTDTRPMRAERAVKLRELNVLAKIIATW